MIRILFVLAMIVSLVTGCNRQRDLVLSREDLKLADSLFLASRTEWSPKLEDSCQVFRDEMLPIWIDSLKELRLAEINLMLEQYEKSK